MSNINLRKIDGVKWNTKTINAIKHLATTQEARELLRKMGYQEKEYAKTILPENMNRKENAKHVPMKQALTVSDVMEKQVRYDKYEKIPSLAIRLNFKPSKKYRYVMLSGKNTYNGVKREIKYTNPNAEPFALQKATRIYEKKLNEEFILLLKKKVKRL